jgi:hypothetical protein
MEHFLHLFAVMFAPIATAIYCSLNAKKLNAACRARRSARENLHPGH